MTSKHKHLVAERSVSPHMSFVGCGAPAHANGPRIRLGKTPAAHANDRHWPCQIQWTKIRRVTIYSGDTTPETIAMIKMAFDSFCASLPRDLNYRTREARKHMAAMC